MKLDINFEYTNNKGQVISIEAYKPVLIEDSMDAKAFCYLNMLRSDFGFNKHNFLWMLSMFARIRFSKHTTSSYMDEGTMKQLSGPFMEPITDETPKERVRYMFRLSEKGVELYNTLEALLLVEEGKEDAALEFIKGYITFKEFA